MALEFENQTPKTINDRMNADVRLAAPRSNPTKKNSFLGGLIKGVAYRIYDFYRLLARNKRESFPDTSTINGELKRWGNYREITQNPETGATGQVIVTGDLGETLPVASLATLDGVTYRTTTAATIAEQSYAIISMSRNGTTVTALTSTAHNLASSLTAVVTGANSAIFNGEFDISVTSATEFTYQVDGDDNFEQATGIISAAFDIAFATVDVSPTSELSGAASNQDAGTVIRLNSTADVNSDLLVSYNGLSGGADLEDADSYRARVISAYQNPVANFNVAAINLQIRQEVPNVTRVWVQPITPDVGEVTIYFAVDNTGIIPTGTDVENVEQAVYAIMPVNTPESAIYVYAPTPLYVDFNFATLEPDTTAMRTAIRERLQELFYTKSEIEVPLTSEDYRAKIKNTIDSSGASVTNFSLTQPLGDITPGVGELPLLRNVTFATGAGEIYIDDMFDGNDGRSSGLVDGFSKSITGSGFLVDIQVTGTFDGATVTLQLYDADLDTWNNLSVTWIEDGTFSGLYVDADNTYRLNITGAGGSTDINAEVYYG